MIGFLKSFFTGEKSAEEQALLSSLELQRKRDVIVIDGGAEEEQSSGGCGTQQRGCGGCGCG